MGDGRFVSQVFDSVATDFNWAQNMITMKGSMSTINEQLQNVRFSRDKPLEEITV